MLVLAPVLLALSVLLPWFQGSVVGVELDLFFGTWKGLRQLTWLCVFGAFLSASWLYLQRSVLAAWVTWFVGVTATVVVVVGQSLIDVANAPIGFVNSIGIEAQAGLSSGAHLQAVGGLMLTVAASMIVMAHLVAQLARSGTDQLDSRLGE